MTVKLPGFLYVRPGVYARAEINEGEDSRRIILLKRYNQPTKDDVADFLRRLVPKVVENPGDSELEKKIMSLPIEMRLKIAGGNPFYMAKIRKETLAFRDEHVLNVKTGEVSAEMVKKAGSLDYDWFNENMELKWGLRFGYKSSDIQKTMENMFEYIKASRGFDDNELLETADAMSAVTAGVFKHIDYKKLPQDQSLATDIVELTLGAVDYFLKHKNEDLEVQEIIQIQELLRRAFKWGIVTVDA